MRQGPAVTGTAPENVRVRICSVQVFMTIEHRSLSKFLVKLIEGSRVPEGIVLWTFYRFTTMVARPPLAMYLGSMFRRAACLHQSSLPESAHQRNSANQEADRYRPPSSD